MKSIVRGFVKTPLIPDNYFVLSKTLTYTEYICLGLIVRWSFGWDRISAVIPLSVFINTAVVSRRAVDKALAELVRKGRIRIERHRNGDREYFPKLEISNGEHWGECSCCGDRQILPNFAFVPYCYFEELPKLCTYSEHIVVGVVLWVCLFWDRTNKILAAKSSGFPVKAIVEMTGLSARAVKGAFKTAAAKGLILKQQAPGKVTDYTVDLEQFSQSLQLLSRKTARKLKPEKAVGAGGAFEFH